MLSLYAEGKPPEQIAIQMGMSVNHVKRNLKIAINSLIKHYADPSPQQTFVRYAAFQFGIIRKLQDTHSLFMGEAAPQSKSAPKQYSAAISALRAQSDIYDKIVSQGKEFGVIQQRQASEHIRKPPTELRVELRKEVETLTRMLDEIDEADELRNKGSTTIRKRITYTVRLRQPMRDDMGVIRALPDWKYRRHPPEPPPTPLTDLTPEQRRLASEIDLTKRMQQELLRHRDDPSKARIKPHELIEAEFKPSHQSPQPSQPKQPSNQEPKTTYLIPPVK
jgi:hypothetical protein